MDYQPHHQQYTYSNNSSMNNFHSAKNYEQSIQEIVGNNNPFIPSSINTNINSTNRNQITSQMNQNTFNYPPVPASNNAFQIKTPANCTNVNQLTNNSHNNNMNNSHNFMNMNNINVGKCRNNGAISPTTTTTASTFHQNEVGFVNAISLDHTSSNSSFSSSATTATTTTPSLPSQNDNLSMYHQNKANCLPQATLVNNVDSRHLSNYGLHQSQQQRIDCNHHHNHTVYTDDCCNNQHQNNNNPSFYHPNSNNSNTSNIVYTSNYSHAMGQQQQQQQQWLEPQQQAQQQQLQTVQWSADPHPRPVMHNNLSNVSSSTMNSSSSHNDNNNSIQIGSTNSQWMNCNGQPPLQQQQPSHSCNVMDSTSYNLLSSEHNVQHSLDEMCHSFTGGQTTNIPQQKAIDNSNDYKFGGVSSAQFHGNGNHNNNGNSDRNLNFQNGLNAVSGFKAISTKSEPVKDSKPKKSAKNGMVHSCHVCGKLFKHKCNLKIHSVIHTSAALSCVYCGKKFARISNLNEHVKIHTNFRPFKCQYCDKTFRQKQTLIDHTRTHTGERPFKCDFCNKAFKVKHNLKSHRRLHTGERPFICSLCPKKFASKSSLNGHIRRKHNAYWKARNQ